MSGQPNYGQMAIGVASLTLGLAVYIFERGFVPAVALDTGSLAARTPVLPGWLSDSAPSFLHAFGFCLLCCGVIGGRRKAGLLIGSFWLVVHSTLELLQHDAIQARVRAALTFAGDAPTTPARYGIGGVYAVEDLLAVAGGCVLAVAITGYRHPPDHSIRQEEPNEAMARQDGPHDDLRSARDRGDRVHSRHPPYGAG